MTLTKITEKEANVLKLIQYIYNNIGCLNPKMVCDTAEHLDISKATVKFIIDGRNFVQYERIADTDVYRWLPTEFNSKVPKIPNIYMAKAIIEKVKSDKKQDELRRKSDGEEISNATGQEYTNKFQLKVDKFMTHVRNNTTDWAPATGLRLRKIYGELNLTDMVLTVMIKMNILMKKGERVNSVYKWNPKCELNPALVKLVVENRAAYAADKSSVVIWFASEEVAPSVKAVAVSEAGADFVNAKREAAVEETAALSKTNCENAGIKGKKGLKHFAWNDDEDWTIITGRKENMSIADMASVLGRSAGSVAGRIHWLKKMGKFDEKPVEEKTKDVVENKPEEKKTVHMKLQEAIHEQKIVAEKKEEPKSPGLFRRILNAIRNK